MSDFRLAIGLMVFFYGIILAASCYYVTDFD